MPRARAAGLPRFPPYPPPEGGPLSPNPGGIAMRKRERRPERHDWREAGVSEAQELEARRAQRLKTAAALQRGRTALQVPEAAEPAATLADQAIRQAIERSPPRPSLVCREGCAWCCHKVVGTSAAEVLRIAAFLRKQLSPAELQAVRERVLRLEEER